MALSITTFITIFWKSIRQLYRHFHPAKVSEHLAVEDHLDDYSSDVDVEEEVPQRVLAVVDEPVSVGATDELSWPFVERRKVGRPWADRPAAKAPDDLSELDWADFVPNVYSIDSTAWSTKGNMRWQLAHPDAWDEADRWLAEALTPERDARVA